MEDIPDDRSLQSLIRKERRSMTCQYYDEEDTSANNLLTNAKAPTPKFISAPKNYDPVKAGFINPNTDKRRSFYESDEDEMMMDSDSNRMMGGSLSHDTSNSNCYSDTESAATMRRDQQETIEPAVEVVINENSHLWTL